MYVYKLRYRIRMRTSQHLLEFQCINNKKKTFSLEREMEKARKDIYREEGAR